MARSRYRYTNTLRTSLEEQRESLAHPLVGRSLLRLNIALHVCMLTHLYCALNQVHVCCAHLPFDLVAAPYYVPQKRVTVTFSGRKCPVAQHHCMGTASTSMNSGCPCLRRFVVYFAWFYSHVPSIETPLGGHMYVATETNLRSEKNHYAGSTERVDTATARGNFNPGFHRFVFSDHSTKMAPLCSYRAEAGVRQTSWHVRVN